MKYVISLLSTLISMAAVSQSSISALIAVDITDDQHQELFNTFLNQELQVYESYLHKAGAFEPGGSATTTILPLSDLGAARPQSISYKKIESSMTEQLVRKRVIIPYFKQLYSIMYDLTKEAAKKDYTRIYENLCAYLNNTGTQDQKLLILFSDGLEHHPDFSFYDGDPTKDLEGSLEILAQSCHCILPDDLSKVKIILVSYRFSENDRFVTNAQHWWKAVFTSRKAEIYTTSALNINHLINPIK